MSDSHPMLDNSKTLRTLTDEDIVTERKVGRRDFLSVGGALVAAAVASGGRASAQDDPDKRPDDKRRPDDQRKPDDKRKTEDRPKTDDTRKRTDDVRKKDDTRRPGDTQKPDDPHQ